MDLMPYVDDLRREPSVAADADGDEARARAERPAAQLEPTIRLTLLRALSAEDHRAAARINHRLPSGLTPRAEKAAAPEGLSPSAWVVRAISAAPDPEERAVAPHPGPGTSADRVGRTCARWVG
ncbi:hypothetical protein ACFWZT_29840 [Streptomyces alboflavus]|uniref:hypothetical protein n=1 Tax=Streptomyces alboflavus TaxID=67267 RepID=UPI00369E164A